MSWLARVWQHPLARDVDIDAADTISVHARIIASKRMLRSVYRRWYGDFAAALEATPHVDGPVVELGCGASHLEAYVPGVVKTDIAPHAQTHLAADAQALPFRDASVRALFGLGILHHLDDPARGLSEAERCLAKDGRLVLIEPSGAPLHRFMVRRFHPHEGWDESVTGWRNHATGRLSSANNALPWIIFVRDRAEFERRFPGLAIRGIRQHTFVAYYLSGGLSYRSFLPGALAPVVDTMEGLPRLFPGLGTMMTIEIARR